MNHSYRRFLAVPLAAAVAVAVAVPAAAFASPSSYTLSSVVSTPVGANGFWGPVATAPDGTVWAAGDSLFHYARSGALIATIGFNALGLPAAPTAGATEIEVADSGDVYVSFARGSGASGVLDVAHLSAAGAVVGDVTLALADTFSPAGYATPLSLDVAPDGTYWLLDTSSVLHYGTDGALLGGFARNASDGSAVTGTASTNSGLEVIPGGDLLVLSAGRLLEYTPAGAYVAQWGAGDGASGIAATTSVGLDADRAVRAIVGTTLETLTDASDRTGGHKVVPATASGSISLSGTAVILPLDAGALARGIDAATGDAAIVATNADGVATAAWTGPDAAADRFSADTRHELSVTSDAQGRVFVLDRALDRVQVISKNSKYLRLWTVPSDAQVVSATRGMVLVAGEHSVTSYDPYGVVKWTYALPAGLSAHIRSSAGDWGIDSTLVADASGRVTIVASGATAGELTVLRLSATGTLLGSWTVSGSADAVSTIDAVGMVIIADGHTVRKYGRGGELKRQWTLATPSVFHKVHQFTISDITVDANGRIYVRQTAGGGVLANVVDSFGAKGVPKDRWGRKTTKDRDELGFYTGGTVTVARVDYATGALQIWR